MGIRRRTVIFENSYVTNSEQELPWEISMISMRSCDDVLIHRNILRQNGARPPGPLAITPRKEDNFHRASTAFRNLIGFFGYRTS